MHPHHKLSCLQCLHRKAIMRMSAKTTVSFYIFRIGRQTRPKRLRLNRIWQRELCLWSGLIVAFSHVSPFMGCMSVYDASTQELLLEKYCSSYAFGDTLDSLAYVEATSGDSGNHKLLNSEDKLLYQTEKKERITNIAVNHTNGDIAIVVGKYLKDGETQKFHVVILAKRGDKYIKVKTQRVKLNSVNSVQWKDDEQIIITNDAGKEVIRK